MFFIRAYLWIAPNLFLLFALLCMSIRKLQRQYWSFVAYLILQLAYFLAEFAVDFLAARHLSSRATYLWILIVGLALSGITEVAVLYELAAKTIFSRLNNAFSPRTYFQWSVGLLLLMGVAVAAALASPSPERLVNIIQNLNVVIYVIAMGLLLAILLLSKTLSIPWRSLPAGITLGFGVAAAGELAGSGVLSILGKNRSGYIASDLVRMGAFHVCALIWLIYVLLPERLQSAGTPALLVATLENRTEELQGMVQR